MKKNLVILLLLFCISYVNAQQIPHYSQYLINDYVLNPAIAGTRNYFEAKSNNRYQWVGINDAPRTYVLSMNGPLLKYNMGLGGYLFTDIVGPTRRAGASLSYAYHLQVTPDYKLGLGLSAGMLQYAVDASKIFTRESNDVALSNGVQSVIVPDANFGTYFYGKGLFAGFTFNQLLNNKLNFFDNSTLNNSTRRMVLHLTGLLGYKYQLNDDFAIEPSAFIKYVKPVPVQVDVSARGYYRDKFWMGVTYRTADAVAISLGYLMANNITFAYSYDYSMSNIQNYSSGTHEIMLGLRFIRKRVPPPTAPLVPAATEAPSETK